MCPEKALPLRGPLPVGRGRRLFRAHTPHPKLISQLALAAVLTLAACGRGDRLPLKLVKVIEVAGRQGVATDCSYYYVSGSTALYKYSLEGELVLSNEEPFAAMTGEVNHIGDIDVHDGEIYAGVEYFMDGVGTNIQVAVYDAETLDYKRSIPWNPDSGQVECCGIAVDAARGHVWMADWVRGDHLYCYDLATGAYVGKTALRPKPDLQQGICVLQGKMLISCDDGDAELDAPDNLYICNLYPATGAAGPGSGNADGRAFSSPDAALSRTGAEGTGSESSEVGNAVLPATDARVELFRRMTDFRRAGEIEGLTHNPETGEIIVLSNRGARIILGMPRGFYDGYDHEIHELYVYSR